MMSFYCKKPLVVEAAKYTGPLTVEIQQLLRHQGFDYNQPYEQQGVMVSRFYIVTVDQNRVHIPVGAYVVLDAKGYPYPCDAEIFEASHELVGVPSAPVLEGKQE